MKEAISLCDIAQLKILVVIETYHSPGEGK